MIVSRRIQRLGKHGASRRMEMCVGNLHFFLAPRLIHGSLQILFWLLVTLKETSLWSRYALLPKFELYITCFRHTNTRTYFHACCWTREFYFIPVFFFFSDHTDTCSWAIPVCMFFSWVYMRPKYHWTQILVCSFNDIIDES
jgi:hypothetical protein